MTISEYVRKVTIDDQPFALTYRLEASENYHYSYDISIEMINFKNGYAYKDTVCNILMDSNDAKLLFDKIILGLVTPISLRYIIEDYLSIIMTTSNVRCSSL